MSATGRNVRTDAAAREALALPDIVAGMGASDIASKHGVSATTARRWMANAKQAIVDGREDAIAKVRTALEAGAPRAVERLRELMESEDGKVALGAVNSWLDRGGVVKTERRELSATPGGEPLFQIAATEIASAAKRKKDGE